MHWHRFHKGGLLTHSLFQYEEQQIYLNLWSEDILSISDEPVSQPDTQIVCLGFGKLLQVHILNEC